MSVKRLWQAVAIATVVLCRQNLVSVSNSSSAVGPGGFPPLPPGKPQPLPAYMVDNTGNIHGTAPDKGILDGPITEPLNSSFEALLDPLDRRQTGTFGTGP